MNSVLTSFYLNFLDFKEDISMTPKLTIDVEGVDINNIFYIDEKIKFTLHTLTINHVHVFTITDKDGNKLDITLSIYSYDDEDYNKYRSNIIIVITSYIKFLCKYFGMTLANFKPLTILIFLTDFKKELPRDKQVLTPFEVNTGVTIDEGNKTTIVVYRKEELIKVLIHELTHYSKIDYITIDTTTESVIASHFGFRPPLYLRESITDFWTICINTMYYSFYDDDGNILSFEMFKRSFLKNIHKEIAFIHHQAVKVLKYNDMCRYKTMKNEKTHVTAYYIVKYLMFKRWIKIITMYKDPRLRNEIIPQLLKKMEKDKKQLCSTSLRPDGDISLRMTSIDINSKMKTI